MKTNFFLMVFFSFIRLLIKLLDLCMHNEYIFSNITRNIIILINDNSNDNNGFDKSIFYFLLQNEV